MNDYNGPDRRAIIALDKESKIMLIEMHTILTDKDMGLVQKVKKHDEYINGNGKIGLKTQILALWILIALLGSDSPIVAKVSRWIK